MLKLYEHLLEFQSAAGSEHDAFLLPWSVDAGRRKVRCTIIFLFEIQMPIHIQVRRNAKPRREEIMAQHDVSRTPRSTTQAEEPILNKVPKGRRIHRHHPSISDTSDEIEADMFGSEIDDLEAPRDDDSISKVEACAQTSRAIPQVNSITTIIESSSTVHIHFRRAICQRRPRLPARRRICSSPIRENENTPISIKVLILRVTY